MLKLNRLTDTAIEPTYATEGSAAFDLSADFINREVYVYFEENCQEVKAFYGFSNPANPVLILEPGERAIIPSGWFFEIEPGWQLDVTPRSGNASRNGITITNSPGIIDSDYTGETFIIVQNSGHDDFVINHGDRIAQAQMKPVYRAPCIKTREGKVRTSGDAGGLGSTGKGE